MASVGPAILSATIQDAEGILATNKIYVDLDDTKTIAQLRTDGHSYLEALDNITDGQIIRAHVAVPIALGGTVKTSPVAGSNVESTGLFNFSQVSSAYKEGVDVPAIAQATIVSGHIDLTNTDIQNWINFITVASSVVTVVSKFNNVLQALLDALRTFRKHRRQLIRASFEEA
jgi:hypothetical protein